MELTGNIEPVGETEMKKTLLVIALALASMSLTFAAPQTSPANQSTAKTQTTKKAKKVKKHAKTHVKKAKTSKPAQK
jgi:Ni/Co efflux regulator RcnB